MNEDTWKILTFVLVGVVGLTFVLLLVYFIIQRRKTKELKHALMIEQRRQDIQGLRQDANFSCNVLVEQTKAAAVGVPQHVVHPNVCGPGVMPGYQNAGYRNAGYP